MTAYDLSHFEIDAQGDYVPLTIPTTPAGGERVYWETDAAGDYYILPVPVETPAPVLTPSGPVAGPVYILGTMLAACDAWQMWTGIDDAVTLAGAHIFQEAIPYAANGQSTLQFASRLRSLHPFAIVSQGDGLSIDITSRLNASVGGTVTLEIEAEIPEMYQGEMYEDVAMIYFQNQIGEVLTDLASLSGSAGYLILLRFDFLEGPARVQRERAHDKGDVIYAAVSCRFGVGS